MKPITMATISDLCILSPRNTAAKNGTIKLLENYMQVDFEKLV